MEILITGKFCTAVLKVANYPGDEVISQVTQIVNDEHVSPAPIIIMPDTHAGMGCVIGYTQELGRFIDPNVVGVDIGCGVLAAKIPGISSVNLEKLDDFIRENVPHGMNNLTNTHKAVKGDFFSQVQDIAWRIGMRQDPLLGIGTLGGGNHFIEVASEDYLIVHSGSRNFGKSICDFYARQTRWHDLHESGANYLADMKVAQVYAQVNRTAIIQTIIDFLKLNTIEYIESVHNYISPKDKIIRKGAISANRGETVIIPLNMRDGCIIGVGKGNPDWNNSAPHGAGRLMSRSQAKKNLSMDEFRETMAGIYSSSISEATLDEAPMAYKSQAEILSIIGETVVVQEIVLPIYNFKA